MSSTRPAKIRSRTGSWSTFERRFRPRTQADDTVLVDIHALPASTEAHRVWTVVDEDGHFYLFPGFRFVNRFAYVICDIPWSEDEQRQPPYLYD